MRWFSPKLPIREEDRQWVNDGFQRLEKLLGRQRLLKSRVVEPIAEDFPDPYDRSADAVELMFSRLCRYMHVERSTIKLEIFPDETEELRELLPAWRSDGTAGAAGFYVHAHERSPVSEEADSRMTVAIRSSGLKDPMSLVATMAHELGHVILLGGNIMRHDTSDHERMTDLLTVFLGLGIFTANSAARFRQFQDNRRSGWSTQRLGYLSEPVFGYALAKFAIERDEHKPRWRRHLSTNVRSDFEQSVRWLIANPQYVPVPEPLR